MSVADYKYNTITFNSCRDRVRPSERTAYQNIIANVNKLE